ncbi:hypothetical protein F511_37501 [Dorcoceras hygrometricum]|uniref:Uncharacterized protein n=1 Tax=Dorcoceras hygrometricum TaxID=472368 RepID=A0A2Z7BQ11_9LAMI|nr:hypothetical protein F511_37501 [Dorcoceras hygrometricum]
MGGRRRREACGRGWAAMRARLYLVCLMVALGIQLAVGPQPLRLRNHNFGLAQWIMVKRLAKSRHDPLGITDSACKNQLVVVSVQYGPFNTYIPIRSTIIDSIGYPRMRASGESSTTKHRLLHASGPHPILPPNDPKPKISKISKSTKIGPISNIGTNIRQAVWDRPENPRSRKTASQSRLGYVGVRPLQYLLSAATVPTFGRYSTCVRPHIEYWHKHPSGRLGQARKSKESKNSVAKPSRVRRRAAATVPAFGRYSTYVRPLQYLRSAATVPAFGRYSACVRPLQYRRPKVFFSFIFEKSKSDAIRHKHVLKDPSLGSDTTVGIQWRIWIPFLGAAAEAPGSDQFHEETGTSNARTDSPRRGDRNKSDHVKNRAKEAAGGGDGRSAAA